MEQLEIFVESLTGSILQFRVSPFETILSLKEKIQNIQGIPVHHQHLIHQDRELDNELSLFNYHIQNGSTLRLIIHLRGGPISTRPLTADLTQQTLLEEMATEYIESLAGENWNITGTDGAASVASGDSESDARAPSTASASPTPVPPVSQSHPRHVTLLVLRDGDQFNFYRVVDRSASSVLPMGSSAIPPFDALVSPSASGSGDDHSTSDAAIHGPGSGQEASVFHGFNDQSKQLKIQEQRVIEDKTRQKMAELRSRMMVGNKQIHMSSGSTVPSATSHPTSTDATPVLIPRPPSSHKTSAMKISNQPVRDSYVPTVSMSGLRHRRVSNDTVAVPFPISPQGGKGPISSPREPSTLSGNNFASLADYFRSKEELTGTLASELHDDSAPPTPTPTRKQNSKVDISDKNQSDHKQPQDVVRCSPYLRELYAGRRFFVVGQEKSEIDSKQNETLPKPLRSMKKPSDVDIIGEPLIQQTSVLSSKPQVRAPSSRIQQHQPTPASPSAQPTRPTGLADAFAALIERQSSQAASSSYIQQVSPSTKKQSGPLRTNQQNGSLADSDGDADVLERALTTLLLKAELEHLGSSRLNMGFISQAQSTSETSAKETTKTSTSTGTARFGGGAAGASSRQIPSYASSNRIPSSNKILTSTNNVSLTGDTARRSALHSAASSPLKLSSTSKLPAITSPQNSQQTLRQSVAPPPIATSATRCAVCNRRTGLATTYVCRCQATFCTVHRYPEAHQCTYDYKAEGRRAIQANNPVITADKLPKI